MPDYLVRVRMREKPGAEGEERGTNKIMWNEMRIVIIWLEGTILNVRVVTRSVQIIIVLIVTHFM